MEECSQEKNLSFFTGDRVCVFKTHRIQVLKTCKNACVKESKHVYLFSQCFGNSRSYAQKNSSDYCDVVSAKLKYLNSYDRISNLVLFIIILEGSHFGLGKAYLFHNKTVKLLNKQVQIPQYFQAPLFYTDII